MKLNKAMVWALTALVIGACRGASLESNAEPQEAQGPQATPVQIAEVGTTTIRDSSTFIANLDSRQAATIRPQVSGQVTDVLVQLGDTVAAGTPLFTIDESIQQAAWASQLAAVNVAEANLETARANLEATKADVAARTADLDFVRSKIEREQELLEEGVIFEEQLEETTRDLAQSEARLETLQGQIRAQEALIAQAEQALRQAQAEAKQEEVQLQYYQVNAPVAGTVGDVVTNAGDYVTPQSLLTSIVQSNQLEVEISIPLDQAPKLQVGTSIDLLDEQNQVIETSQISFISPEADPGTQSVLVKATFSNAAGLRTSQFIRTRVIWSEAPSLVIPFTSVSRIAGQTFVFVAQPTEDASGLVATQRPVQLGKLQDNDYQVLGGLSEGETIVTSGLQKIFDQAPIVDESLLQPPAEASPG